jgi:hypothetical protein
MDLDAWRATHPTWSYTDGGYTYRARPVSARAVASLVEKLEAAKTPRQQFTLYERLFRLAFPWVPHYAWRGDPVKKIMALEPIALKAVQADFFRHLGGSGTTRAPETNTTPSLT